MEASSPNRRKFALLIDADPASRDLFRLLLPRGLQIIQSRTGATGLDLLQRVPARFGLALVSLVLPGLPGVVVIDIIRLFRPEIPVICLVEGRASLTAEPCLSKLSGTAELRAQLAGAMTREGTPWVGPAASAAAVEQAKSAFALSGDLNHAARELARGMPGNSAAGR